MLCFLNVTSAVGHKVGRLKDVLDDEKLLRSIMTKADNRFVISLYIGYILYHCNAKKVLIYSSDVYKCVHLRDERTQKSTLINLSIEL